MYQAVLVYNSDPLLTGKIAQALLRRDSNVDHYLDLLATTASKMNTSWHFELDQTNGDIQKLLAQDYDLIICLPGMQHRLIYPENDPRLYFLDNVEFRADEVDLLWARLNDRQRQAGAVIKADLE
ncbi:hypothetical protein [Lapidilactobacillus luobeiensis]|uniref:hypothetical protein n=1 Tax=Lapidilactobacillus luobeiensis TaxID=2950371 RepID=UPI0021C330EF|nr:hypothetical protein [Lapidilactobacillus luobeiensis]